MKKLLMLIFMLSMGSLCWAQTAPSLGSAATFAVLGSSNVTCTAPGIISGDVGVSPGLFTNTTGCIVVGTVHQGDSAAINALMALNTAYQFALSHNSICTSNLADAPLLPLKLTPGVYCNNSAAGLTFTGGTLTLDASGNPNAVWIFKIAHGLTGSAFKVVMINGGQPCNVFWLVGADSTSTNSTLQGNILAGGLTGSFTSTDSTLIGRVLANGAVTLTRPNVHGSCAIAAQGAAGCDADDNDEHHHDKHRDDEEKDRKERD
ncbi:MAG TPA: ice-binding family protein [Candidatus Acidoferrum sp.]|nr:ice-binding family protein [Candidatus Acidoferrum sp.]